MKADQIDGDSGFLLLEVMCFIPVPVKSYPVLGMLTMRHSVGYPADQFKRGVSGGQREPQCDPIRAGHSVGEFGFNAQNHSRGGDVDDLCGSATALPCQFDLDRGMWIDKLSAGFLANKLVAERRRQ